MKTTRHHPSRTSNRPRCAPERYQPTSYDITREIRARPPPAQDTLVQQDPWLVDLCTFFALIAITYFVTWSLHGAVQGFGAMANWLGSFTAAQLLHGSLIGAGATLCYLIPIIIFYPQIFC